MRYLLLTMLAVISFPSLAMDVGFMIYPVDVPGLYEAALPSVVAVSEAPANIVEEDTATLPDYVVNGATRVETEVALSRAGKSYSTGVVEKATHLYRTLREEVGWPSK